MRNDADQLSCQQRCFQEKHKGIFMVAGASVLYGIIPLLVKKILLGGMDISCVIAYRFLIMAILTGSISLTEHKEMHITIQQGIQLVVTGVLGIGMTNFLLGCAYLRINMWMATVCHFIYPVIVMLIMYWFYRRGINRNEKTGAVLTAVGFFILLIFSKNMSLSGIVFAVLSGIAYGFYMICMEMASFAALDKMVITCYLSFSCAIYFLAQSIATHNLSILISTSEWCILVCSSIMSLAAMLFLTKGVSILGASRASYLNLLEPVSNVCADFMFYKVMPTLLQFIGCCLILAAVLVVALPDRNSNAPPK